MEKSFLKGLVEENEGKPYNICHRCYQFSREVVVFIRDFEYPKIFDSIFDQLIRSVTSIAANVVEAISGSSIKDFIKFYTIALKSANETKYWLCLIRDTIIIEKDKVCQFLKEAVELSKILATIIKSSKRRLT